MSDYEKKIEEMNEEESMEPDVYEFEDENGETEKFYHLGTVEFKKKWYIVLQPTVTTDFANAEDLVAFELATDENGEDVFLSVADEPTINGVYKAYVSLCEGIEIVGDEDEGCGCGGDCGCENKGSCGDEGKEHSHEHGSCGCGCGCKKD